MGYDLAVFRTACVSLDGDLNALLLQKFLEKAEGSENP